MSRFGCLRPLNPGELFGSFVEVDTFGQTTLAEQAHGPCALVG
jgi:hypothetical protein